MPGTVAVPLFCAAAAAGHPGHDPDKTPPPFKQSTKTTTKIYKRTQKLLTHAHRASTSRSWSSGTRSCTPTPRPMTSPSARRTSRTCTGGGSTGSKCDADSIGSTNGAGSMRQYTDSAGSTGSTDSTDITGSTESICTGVSRGPHTVHHDQYGSAPSAPASDLPGRLCRSRLL